MPNETTPALDLLNLLQLDRILWLILSLFVMTAIVKILQRMGTSLQNQFPVYRLVILQVTTIISYLLYIFGGGVLTYAILSPPKELLLAVGGSAAVAIGFALKDLVGSFIAGIVLLFDRPFQVGDRITFDGIYGDVLTIGLRSVRVKTLDDSIFTIPNIKFFTDTVQSANAGSADMMVSTKFHVSLDTNVNEVKELLYEIVATSRYTYLKKPIHITAEECEVAERLAICLTVKAYVLDIQYEKNFQTDIVIRATEMFRTTGVLRPTING